jgi:hypothetical protein
MKKSLFALAFAASTLPALALDAPVAQLDVSGATYTLSWSAVDGAESYQVYSMTEAWTLGSMLAEVGSEVLSYDVTGSGQFFYVKAWAADSGPGAAPVPTGHDAADVISVFSDSFSSLAGTDFFPWWWQSTVASFVDLEGNQALEYANFNYQGIQLAAAQDLSLMEYVHLDVWTENEAAANAFLISASTGEQPYAMAPSFGSWNSYDIPLSHFTDLGLSISDIHQLKFDGGTGGTIYLDNIYFWKNPTASGTDATLSDLTVDGSTVAGFVSSTLEYDVELPYGSVDVPVVDGTTTDPAASYVVNAAGGLPGVSQVVVTAADGLTSLTYNVSFTVAAPVPLVAAPAPTAHPDSVLSIYSDAYTNLAGSNFNPWWGQSTLVTVDHPVAGDNTLLYANLNYQGTNLGGFDGVAQDVSAYGYFHLDFWTPNASALNFFLISGSTGERAYALPITTESWVGVDIPLSHFTNLGMTMTDIFQIKVDGGNGSTVVYFDNWYFHGVAETVELTEPSEAAPTPTYDAGNVISLFSNAYTNVTVDTWSAGWDVANVSDVQVFGDDTKLYENLLFAGIEFTSNTIDASAMTHFRMDFWTPDATDLPAAFRIKLVDFGADGAWSGGDDVEHEITLAADTVPALQSQNWVSFDIPLSEFTNLVTTGHLAQLIISGDPNTVYIDNVLFHN